jgi:hypothetical protein
MWPSESNGLHPPQPTWDIAAIERHPRPGHPPNHNPFVISIVNQAREDFDLVPD